MAAFGLVIYKHEPVVVSELSRRPGSTPPAMADAMSWHSELC